jgi:hypothetical protein
MKRYPDVSVLLALKEARRKAVAKLPIEEKAEIANRLRSLAKNAGQLLVSRGAGQVFPHDKKREG